MHSTTWTIAAPGESDFPALRAIELASFATLRATGAVTGEPVASTMADLKRYLQCGLLYAAFTAPALPRGFCGGFIEQQWLHIAEMDVHPDWQKRGIGRQLLERLLQAGREKLLCGATLTTDRLAAFNAPFYASLGFNAPPESARPSHLNTLLAAEMQCGFNPERRVAMVYHF